MNRVEILQGDVLVRLRELPDQGIVLDCFAGSGSTLIAAGQERTL